MYPNNTVSQAQGKGVTSSIALLETDGSNRLIIQKDVEHLSNAI
jgi:hypothetical protein